MLDEEKVCPKCEATMVRAAPLFSLSASTTGGPSKDVTLQLLVYVCPTCQYVEMYRYN